MEQIELDALDKAVISVLQEDFPIVVNPYKVLAEKIGVSEEVFLQKTERLMQLGAIRKMGAVLKHRKAGFSSNVLCAWEVPIAELKAVAEKMCEHAAVSHCYDRNTYPDWPYNLYTMIHAATRDECEQIVLELSKLTGIESHIMLYTKKEWKKTSTRYFAEK